FFNCSVRGQQKGASVEFRGIRLRTVAEVPFTMAGIAQRLNNDVRSPVLIRIEPGGFKTQLGTDFNFEQQLKDGVAAGLRASLKSANLLTVALYIDLDFYNNAKPVSSP
ncbi:MCE family protein, partial [Erwinia amylovora]